MKLRIVACLALAACSGGRSAPPGDDPSTAVVDEARAVVKIGAIGATKPTEATYALVDVENRSSKDRLVTISGTLLDEAGAEVGALSADELRVPAGGTRTYALISAKPVATARRAKFKVLNAVAIDYPPQIVLSEEQVKHGDLTVATAVARNVIEKEATAVIAATFYGPGGAILSRPFTVVPLAEGGTRQLRFEGPKESERVVVFVGQVAFH